MATLVMGGVDEPVNPAQLDDEAMIIIRASIITDHDQSGP
jgi:hypothetical protein